jgi:YD repeat-containing protein
VNDTWTYNDFGEPESYQARVHGSVLYQLEFERDRLGRITEKRETVGGLTTTFVYVYDLAGRLDQVFRDGSLISDYSFDSNSNRVGWQRDGAADDCLPDGDVLGSYDAQDRMLGYGRCTFTYTEAGELRTKTRTDTGAVTTYTYDDFGNLRQVLMPNGDQIEYLIDGRHRRVGKKLNGVLVQQFLYMNQLEPVAELDGNGTLVARFIYADRAHVPAYIVKGPDTYRVIADHLGSVRFVVHQGTGAIAQAIEYDEYGRVLADSAPGFQPFGFAGGIYEPETGLVRFGARCQVP